MPILPRNNFLVKDFHMHNLYSLVRLRKNSDQYVLMFILVHLPKPWCGQLPSNYAIVGGSQWKDTTVIIKRKDTHITQNQIPGERLSQVAYILFLGGFENQHLIPCFGFETIRSFIATV